MKTHRTIGIAWGILSAAQRRRAMVVLAVMLIAALSSAMMVASSLPFLSVLSDPSRIETNTYLAWAWERFGFTSSYSFLVALGVAALAIIVLSNGLQLLRIWMVSRFVANCHHSVSTRLLAAYLRQPYEFFLNRNTGKLSAQVLAESSQVSDGFLQPLAEASSGTLTATAVVTLVVLHDPLVASGAVCVLGGCYWFAYRMSRRRLDRIAKTRFEANAAQFRTAREALVGIKDLKLLGKEHAYHNRFSGDARRVADSQAQVALLMQAPSFALHAVAFGGVFLLCLLLIDPAAMASGNALGSIVPTLGLFAFAGQRLMPELFRVYSGFTRLRAATPALISIAQDISDAKQLPVLPDKPATPMGLKRRLELDCLGYQYPETDQAGLSGITLSIRAGEKIGIVGTTGAGKTTLADTVLGLLLPTAGEMRADGDAITARNLRSWQRTVGYVPQDIFLTDSSLAENIALGERPEDIDWIALHRAARIAQLEQFVQEELADGYDTVVGERGVRLSGGQRQRVGIARALYHDADLIVFDEATSALDNVTERDVIAAVENLPGEKTVIMIAHRLTTVRQCDRLVVLERGQIVGVGTWDELIEENGVFQRIARVA